MVNYGRGNFSAVLHLGESGLNAQSYRESKSVADQVADRDDGLMQINLCLV
ncbi:hypothetical protein HORM4_910008 [Vibrio harveyi]|nr:hypothetical protein HORM4_910008 [Vibrio harveyi]